MFSIEQLFLFRGIDAEKTQLFISWLPAAQSYTRGSVIFDSVHFEKAVGVFVKGKGVAIARDERGVKNFFDVGACFGAASMFEAGPKYVSVIRARTNCEVVFISEEILRRMFAEDPQVMMNYITFLSNKIRFLNTKVDQLMGGSVESKLLRFLADNADSDGHVRKMSMVEMSGLSNIGRTSIYRSLDELVEEGHIKFDEDELYLVL